MNWKSIFGSNKSSVKVESEEFNDAYYDKQIDFYYTNLINSLILFTFTTNELEKLAGPVFNPISELESEIDYAYTPVCFDTIFRNERIEKSFKNELISFKKRTDEIPAEIWDWEFIDNHDSWIEIRKKANELLDKLGITNREYNDDYTTVYDNEGNIIKKGKNCS
ncbi:hypothetical protein [Lacinutrix algicola]|uniref:hypothetical protein n=1 Tax=Lacinutrix algicola TaxID=342954 RepID=UPI000A54D6C5|nr:hypothetical protein [Lacinutrix algicola]